MNKSEANALNAQIREVVKPLLEAHGLKLVSGNATFGEAMFNVNIKSIDPNADIPEWQLDSFGLPKETKVGVEFTYGQKRYRFDGIAPKRPKYPISATDMATGKQFKLGREAVGAIRKEVEKNYA
jgi:hypothetical protein